MEGERGVEEEEGEGRGKKHTKKSIKKMEEKRRRIGNEGKKTIQKRNGDE